MSLNPVQFGKQVIDQFGRYLRTTFPIADERLSAQVADALRHKIAGEPLLYRGPYVYLNRPFEPGPALADLVAEPSLGLHPALKSVFGYNTLHKHQELALRAILAGRHTVVATGTGSGKTEAFLLPILNHCFHLRDAPSPRSAGRGAIGEANRGEGGLVAILVYPMNALVNDQLDRLRWMLAGTRITFGRYTGDTPDQADSQMLRMDQPRAYTNAERQAHADGLATFGAAALPLPWEECYDRESIAARQPRLLLTNYSQLEYLLLRDKDLALFRGAPLRFLVFDEVHTYTGELGSEVACLIRRLRHVAGKTPDEVVCIGTSATVSRGDSASYPWEDDIDVEATTRRFAHRLFGVPEDRITFVAERFIPIEPRPAVYSPPVPADTPALLARVLDEAWTVQQRDEPGELPPALLQAAEELCGKQALTLIPDSSPYKGEGGVNDRLYDLLQANSLVLTLNQVFSRPLRWEEALPRVHALGRQSTDDETLIAEMLAYLTLGALVQRDGEPLLRPKLHYFLQGFQGLYVSLEDDGPRVHFDADSAAAHTERFLFPLVLCRACGQHYFEVVASDPLAADVDGQVTGYRLARAPGRFEAIDEEHAFHLTDVLCTADEDEQAGAATKYYVCSSCSTLHSEPSPHCLNPKCQRMSTLVQLVAFPGPLTACPACGASNRGNLSVIRDTRSAEVADVTILSQSMLSAMPEPSMRKLLVFADNRQDAAFQAGWMESRSKRFRMRHLLYGVLHNTPYNDPIGLGRLSDGLLDQALSAGVLDRGERGEWDDKDERTYVRWFLLEEFASSGQRRTSLEQLGLAAVHYAGLAVDSDHTFFEHWAILLKISPQECLDLAHVLLDYYRRRGLLSDPLLCRYWTPQDPEVRKGLVWAADYARPKALTLLPAGRRSGFVMGWLASNGRSGPQTIVDKATGASKQRDDFLKALWDWLQQHEFLVPVDLVQRRRGRVERIQVGGEGLHVNADKLGFAETEVRQVCNRCGRAQAVALPGAACPEYNCKGRTAPGGREQDHYDVVQYTRMSFTPMKAYEHSAQVPRKTRNQVEREFKKADGAYNVLVCTPTLELGVDIGKLEMALMRNVPPTPANYAQRAGRAGRRHRIAVVFTYCRGHYHDRYFFNDPAEMIAGEIRVPAFSMRNEPLIRKHVHSATLTALRELAGAGEADVLADAFPSYIWAYFGQLFEGEDHVERIRYFDAPREFPKLAALILRHRETIMGRLAAIFAQAWPVDDAQAVSRDTLGRYLDEMTSQLESHARQLFKRIRAYRDRLAEYRRTEEQNLGLTPEEYHKRKQFEYALASYQKQTLGNYTLSYLCNDGFLPGYALSRESVVAQCIDPLIELSRPAAVALREFTPANWVYADRHIYRVQTLNFYKLKAEDSAFTSSTLQRVMRFDRQAGRVWDPAVSSTEGGLLAGAEFSSFQLTDVDLAMEQDIDDRRDRRYRIAFDTYGLLLGEHGGGHGGHILQYKYRYLTRSHVRLVNMGPSAVGPASPGVGFPVCPLCGESRSPFATDAEISAFAEAHRTRCRTEVVWTALHVELPSDVLVVGPCTGQAEAVNVFEAVRIGARMVLDMGATEIDGFVQVDEGGACWAVLYDPLPGGSGFLPEILNYWPAICQRAAGVLETCTCKKACYKCMLHFRNQQYHDVLDRLQAVELMGRLAGEAVREYDIPSVVIKGPVDKQLAESGSEERFQYLLEARHVPLPPEKQYRVELGTGYTVADFAYPQQRVLVFIDGMSASLHGDPEQRRKDKLKRAQARMQGWHVVESTAEGLKDETTLGLMLDELALYLGQGE
ncbi:MAG: DEAD/DEAH box helicase [Thermoflexales bacterium]|nr:DEAD/DEAH box helicase [Thermoflexales bacterium]